jgi:hypothetical protein
MGGSNRRNRRGKSRHDGRRRGRPAAARRKAPHGSEVSLPTRTVPSMSGRAQRLRGSLLRVARPPAPADVTAAGPIVVPAVALTPAARLSGRAAAAIQNPAAAVGHLAAPDVQVIARLRRAGVSAASVGAASPAHEPRWARAAGQRAAAGIDSRSARRPERRTRRRLAAALVRLPTATTRRRRSARPAIERPATAVRGHPAIETERRARRRRHASAGTLAAVDDVAAAVGDLAADHAQVRAGLRGARCGPASVRPSAAALHARQAHATIDGPAAAVRRRAAASAGRRARGRSARGSACPTGRTRADVETCPRPATSSQGDRQSNRKGGERRAALGHRLLSPDSCPLECRTFIGSRPISPIRGSNLKEGASPGEYVGARPPGRAPTGGYMGREIRGDTLRQAVAAARAWSWAGGCRLGLLTRVGEHLGRQRGNSK